jgi:hypothetical protein
VGLTFDAVGNLYVADGFASSICEFSAGALAALSTTPFATGMFAAKNAGHDIPITISGFTLVGAQARDYTPVLPALAADITPAPLTISAIGYARRFDGTTRAAATPVVVGLQGGDTVTGLTEAYADPNPGTDKTLVVTGYTINDGNAAGDGADYTVTLVANHTGVIELVGRPLARGALHGLRRHGT